MHRAAGMNPELPNVDQALFEVPAVDELLPAQRPSHPPRFLMLYGSARERSYSRLLTLEAARLLEAMGGERRIFDPRGLPLPDGAPDTPSQGAGTARARAAGPKAWSGRSPERHGAMTGHHEGADRLDPADGRRRAAHARQDAGGHASVRRLASRSTP